MPNNQHTDDGHNQSEDGQPSHVEQTAADEEVNDANQNRVESVESVTHGYPCVQ
jgi:hypothetical protein